MTARKKTTSTAKEEVAQDGTDQTPELVGAGLGQVAYEAYVGQVGGKSVRGEALPSWEDQDPKVAAAWCAAAQAVITATIIRKD